MTEASRKTVGKHAESGISFWLSSMSTLLIFTFRDSLKHKLKHVSYKWLYVHYALCSYNFHIITFPPNSKGNYWSETESLDIVTSSLPASPGCEDSAEEILPVIVLMIRHSCNLVTLQSGWLCTNTPQYTLPTMGVRRHKYF